jgi:cobalt-zinc-cadmium efflux system membrane fusion protein
MVLHGRIDNISDSVDPSSLTLKVRVVLPNPGHRLKPQMYCTMAANGHPRSVFVVAATSVIQSGRDTFVYVETAPGKYERRAVSLGETHADNDEVTQGLNDGDKVVATGAELLRAQEAQ